MKNQNMVIITGNLVRDPEMKFTPSGAQICNFSIANNRDYGETKRVNYFDVTAWNKLAEVCNQYLTKGNKVIITGELRQERWEKDGKTQSKISITANEIEFLSVKSGINSEPQDPYRTTGSPKDQDAMPEPENNNGQDIPW